MKKTTKITSIMTLIVALLLSMTTMAFAATSHTEGLKDGLYTAETAPNANMMNTYFKLQVIVTGGKVESSTMELRVKGYPTAIPASFAANAPTEEAKAFITNTIPEIGNYNTQMKNLLDGAKVVKFSDAVSTSKAYDHFQTLWKDVVSQAGGKIVADATTATSTTTSNPKTGDNGNLVYILLGGAAVVGMVVLGRKKLTA